MWPMEWGWDLCAGSYMSVQGFPGLVFIGTAKVVESYCCTLLCLLWGKNIEKRISFTKMLQPIKAT